MSIAFDLAQECVDEMKTKPCHMLPARRMSLPADSREWGWGRLRSSPSPCPWEGFLVEQQVGI